MKIVATTSLPAVDCRTLTAGTPHARAKNISWKSFEKLNIFHEELLQRKYGYIFYFSFGGGGFSKNKLQLNAPLS